MGYSSPMSRKSFLLAAAILGLSVVTPARSAGPGPLDQANVTVERLRAEASTGGLCLSERPRASDPYGFRVVLEASPHQLLFYSPIEGLYAPLGSAGWQTGGGEHKFPEVYGPSIPRHMNRRVAVIGYSIDVNSDGRLTTEDRNVRASLATASKKDVVLLRRVYGAELRDGAPVPRALETAVVQGVIGWIDESDLAAASSPRALFAYTLSEPFAEFDFNGDGDRLDEVAFGDSNGDGLLDEREHRALVTTTRALRTDMVDNLDVDARFRGGGGKASLLDRVLAAHPGFGEADARLFIKNGIVRVELNLVVEYADQQRRSMARRRVQGTVDFAPALRRARNLG